MSDRGDSTAALLAEIQSLRQDLAALSSRVLALETRRSEPAASTPVSLSSPITVNYGGGPLPEVPPLPAVGPSAEAATQRPVSPSSAADYTQEERAEIAREIGQFFRRALRGEHRGESGRQRLKLSSRIFVLVRDIRGNTYNPVRIFDNFSAINPFVKENGLCGDSIFVGLPSQWEARVAVAEAGLEWPADVRR